MPVWKDNSYFMLLIIINNVKKKYCIIGCETHKHTTVGEALSIWRQCTSVNFYCTLHECGFTYSPCLFPCFLQPTEEIKNSVSNMFRNDCCHTPPEDNSYCMSIKFFSRIKQKIQYIYFTSAILMTARKKTWSEVDTQNRFLARMRKANDFPLPVMRME